MVVPWVAIMVMVDDNNVIVDLVDIDPNIDDDEEEEIK